MVTLEQISWIIENYHTPCITKVKIVGDCVCSKLESWIDPDQPYTLAVRPIEEKLMLNVSVYPIMKIRRNIDTFRMLLNLNFRLLSCGSASVKTNGEVILKIGYPCEDCDSSPSPWMVFGLLDECFKELRMVEHFLLWATMIDAGISPEQARQTVNTLLKDKLEYLKEQSKDIQTKNHNGGNNQ
jgi:hypothetical protein